MQVSVNLETNRPRAGTSFYQYEVKKPTKNMIERPTVVCNGY